MELESYIDRLNNAIEGLESEQLTVTNNIINLKEDYNTMKVEYDIMRAQMDIESVRYGDLLMKNVRFTTQQNKTVIEKIQNDQEELDKRRNELEARESELLTKMSEVCEKTEKYEENFLELSGEKNRIDQEKEMVKNLHIQLDISTSRLSSLIMENEKKEQSLEEKIKQNDSDKSNLEKDLQIFQKKRELQEKEHNMKEEDMLRREGEIQRDRLQISDEWNTLKRAKEHIDNLKQGNQ